VSREPLRIVHVTPHPWGGPDEINDYAGSLARALAKRGHDVLIAAPSESRAQVREGRAAIRAALDDGARIDGRWRGETAGDDGPPVVAIGQGVAIPGGPRPRTATVPLDLSRTVERMLTGIPFDIVHVHDPFAPGASSIALRHSRSLNVGTFHVPTERLLSTQVARPLVEIFFGRLDARTAASEATRALIERYFPGTYELVEPGADPAPPRWPDGAPARTGSRLRIAFCLREERGALRLFLRGLRRLSAGLDWEAAIWVPAGADPPLRLARALRERVRVTGEREIGIAELIAGADILCLASGGPRPAPGVIRQGLASGTVPVASRIGPYVDAVADGEHGLLFPPGDPLTLAGQIARLGEDRALRAALVGAASRATRPWAAVAEDVEEIYRRALARRHDPRGDPALRRRLTRRRTINVDLHMHTDHSPDCATPVEVLLATAKDRGLGAIAITDHNEISGALAGREVAAQMGGIEVIVAEEVKTAEQGEVIGLFLEERIARGMTMAETIAEIRRQGGLVYVPHPFDRLHSVPDYEHLLDVVEEIDILEVFNPRVALTAFNEEAERFAAKYRIVPGAGSDSHVAQGLGSVMIRLHEFDGAREFLEAMRDADIVRRRKNLVYVQALKFLQTTASPPPVRRARAQRPAKPVRGGQRRPKQARGGQRRGKR
jgi:predicted metal-dependent phosphoesterase TrpH/glycosyltransferase involved in cell wall biosynthesis